MMFLYDLPNWFMGILVITVTVGLALALYFAFKWLFPNDFEEGQVGTAMTFMGVVATITSLLLAFSAVSVWEAYNAADSSVMNEANDVSMLARDLGSYSTPEALKTRAVVKAYVKTVLEEEWPLMADGHSSAKAWDLSDDIFHAAAHIEVDTAAHEVLLGEIWQRINDITKHRRERIQSSQSEVPITLWVVVILGCLFTFLFTCTLPRTGFHLSLITSMAASLGLVFFFIISMDHPFAGEEHISSERFALAIKNMDRWDANEAAAKSRVKSLAVTSVVLGR